MQITLPDSVPPQRVTELFTKLVHGRHISEADKGHYSFLREYFSELQKIFWLLGYDLKRHNMEFFYFETRESGANNASPAALRVAVLVYIAVDYVADTGGAVVNELLDGHRYFDITQKPYIGVPRYEEYLRAIDLDPNVRELSTALESMVRLGVAERHNTDLNKFRFLSPAYRFIDHAVAVAREQDAAEDPPKGDEAES